MTTLESAEEAQEGPLKDGVMMLLADDCSPVEVIDREEYITGVILTQ